MSFNFVHNDIDLERIGRYRQAMDAILSNAGQHHEKIPTLSMLLEEVSELGNALVGAHEHRAQYELIQIGGIVLNWLANKMNEEPNDQEV